MKKVRILVLKSKLEGLIKDLHTAGVVDIRKSSYEGLGDGAPLASFDRLSAGLLGLRAALSIMEASLGKRKDEAEPELIDGAKALEETEKFAVGEKLKSLNQQSAALIETIKTLENGAAIATKLSHYPDVDFSRLGTRTLTFKAGEMAPEKVQPLKAKLEALGASIIHEPAAPAVLVLFERSALEKVEAALAESEFEEMDIPPGMTTPAGTLARVKKETADAQAALKKVQDEMAALSRDNIAKVRSLMRSLDAEAARAEIASHFASSRNVYIIEGWATADSFGALNTLVQGCGDAAMLEDVQFSDKEMPPTVLDNPEIARPLEFITKTFSMPNYYELDPTVMYFLVFPIMYGMMVGDVLYGILSMAIASLLMKKFKDNYTMHSVAKIWFFCGIPTILFGILFNEYGGMTLYAWSQIMAKWTGVTLLSAPLYVGFSRMDNVLILLAVTAAIGWLHLAIGFIMGAINEWHHNRKHAYAKIAWIGVEISVVLMLLPYVAGLSMTFLTAGIALLALCIVALAFTEGFMGVVEIPSLLGNIISYTRIAAMGLVGIVMAELINQFLVPLPADGFLAIVLLPIFLGLHVLNCFVAMFESLIQGGRLNIVEFRTKFMQGGEELFEPFALKKS
jgi:V/A-type H+-transporting ATPase subunit I